MAQRINDNKDPNAPSTEASRKESNAAPESLDEDVRWGIRTPSHLTQKKSRKVRLWLGELLFCFKYTNSPSQDKGTSQ